MKKAVVLLSGGMDSTTAAAMARQEGFDVYALSFRYGQRHVVELEAARRVAAALPASRHVVLDIDLRAFGGSALTRDVEVPKDTPLERIGAEGVPVTYVPARNTIFLSFALGWAEVLGARDIFIGANALDYSGYPDCRPEYIAAFERMANLGTRAGVEGDGFRIHTPLIALSKREIVLKGARAGRGLRPDLDLLRSLARRCGLRPVRRLSAAAQGVQGGGVGRPAKICREERERGRKSVSGKRFRPAHAFSPRSRSSFPAYLRVCLRRQGNLLHPAGRGCADRPAGGLLPVRRVQPVDGPGSRIERRQSAGSATPISSAPTVRAAGSSPRAVALAAAVAAAWPDRRQPARRFVVCTGGEPLLQMDQELVDALHAEGFEVAVETNGTQEPPPGIDWLTVSPKAGAALAIRRGDELKLVYPQEEGAAQPERFEGLEFHHFFLQPMDGPAREANTAARAPVLPLPSTLATQPADA